MNVISKLFKWWRKPAAPHRIPPLLLEIQKASIMLSLWASKLKISVEAMPVREVWAPGVIPFLAKADTDLSTALDAVHEMQQHYDQVRTP